MLISMKRFDLFKIPEYCPVSSEKLDNPAPIQITSKTNFQEVEVNISYLNTICDNRRNKE